MHIKSIYEDKELEAGATLKNFLTVRQEGNRQVNRNLEYYNLDMIIAVGYRVNSKRATEFLTALSCRQKLEPVNSKVTLASEFIYTRFHSKIRTSQLAESLNVSPWHLKQLFVKEYNVTPGRYVKERQFELAKQLLASDMQIQNIAVQLGYSSGFAFSHAFKKRTGLSPREWRKQKKSSTNV